MEKRGNLFDLTMGTYNDAEICELVGLLILWKFHQLAKINNFGLYIGHWSVIAKNMSVP